MSSGGEKEFVLAKVYASAMLELAQEGKQAEALEKELRDFADFVEKDEALASYLESPTVDQSSRQKAIEKWLRGKYSDLLVDSLQVLNRNDRLVLIQNVAAAFHELVEEATGRVEVFVRTASPLNDTMRQQLRDMLGKALERQVDLVEKIDDALIGGLVAQVGDRKFDHSVRRRLHDLGQMLLDRASREIHRGALVVG